jgi:hypothetical protein
MLHLALYYKAAAWASKSANDSINKKTEMHIEQLKNIALIKFQLQNVILPRNAVEKRLELVWRSHLISKGTMLFIPIVLCCYIITRAGEI